MDIIFSVISPFFSHMRRQAQKQHLKAKLASSLGAYYEDKADNSNRLKNCLKRFSVWHKLYVLTLLSFAARLLLASLAIQKGKNFRLKGHVHFLQYDALMSLLTTSIAYFTNAFTLVCLSLAIGIALTIDWILRTKFSCLFFRQAYDLLVVNTECLILLNDRLLRLTSGHLLCPWRLTGYLRGLLAVWREKVVLRFASARLTNFDPTICTPAVRGKAVLLVWFLEFVVTCHVNGTVVWLNIIAILANYYAFHYPLLKILQLNLDLAALCSAIFYFLFTGFAFGFSLLLVGMVTLFQIKVLNRRFSRLASLLKTGQLHFTSGRLLGSALAYHWVAHRRMMTSVDRFNGDILCWASASLLTYVTPFNIYLLTAIVFTKDGTSASGSPGEKAIESVDNGSLISTLTYQIVAISTASFALCALVERLHASAGDMHGLQLWLRASPVPGNGNNNFSAQNCEHISAHFSLPVVSLHTKWKYLTHYEIVHTNAKHFFTIGPLPLSKKSALDFMLFYFAYVLYAADLFIGKDYARKSYQLVN